MQVKYCGHCTEASTFRYRGAQFLLNMAKRNHVPLRHQHSASDVLRGPNQSEQQQFHSSANVPQDRSNWPAAVFSTEPMTMLKSKFQGHATSCSPSIAQPDSKDLDNILEQIARTYPGIKRATHCMYAWRVRASTSRSSTSTSPSRPSKGSTDVQPPISTSILSGSCDGNESGAGERLSRLLELGGYENVIVIVHRWYGGVKLGSDRWKCISGAAKEALQLGGFPRGGEQTSVSQSSSQGSKGKKGRKSKA
ncbi:unnamed protein product [Somion occarium]|uniref:Impact N-terminal domain-containing protein n=1 Tax=Somion occarium TaxID=3059160 RepID=A0ABP1DVB5_9APHY